MYDTITHSITFQGNLWIFSFTRLFNISGNSMIWRIKPIAPLPPRLLQLGLHLMENSDLARGASLDSFFVDGPDGLGDNHDHREHN